MKRIGIRLLLALAGLVLAAFAAELAARGLDVWGVSHYADVETYKLHAIEGSPEGVIPSGRLFQNKPSVALTELRTFEYRTDARRLRTHVGRVEPEGAMPILFLGDSVTLCWGVDDEDSWVRRLESLARAPDGRPLACMNLGHLMYDTVQEASLLRAFGPALAPEVVVLTFIYNDVHPTYDQLAEVLPATPQEAAAIKTPGPVERLADRLFPTLRKLAKFQRERRRVRTEDRSQFPPYSYYPSGWPRCAAALDDVERICESLGATLVVHDKTEPVIPDVRAWAERSGVVYVTSSFSDEDRLRYANSVIDQHMNEEGNAIVAGMVAEQLIDAGVLAPAR